MTNIITSKNIDFCPVILREIFQNSLSLNHSVISAIKICYFLALTSAVSSPYKANMTRSISMWDSF